MDFDTAQETAFAFVCAGCLKIERRRAADYEQ